MEGMDDGRGGRWEAAQEINEELRGSSRCAGAEAQVSTSFPASSLGDAIAGGRNDNGLGLGLGL